MSKAAQQDFSGGIWRELDAPPGYVYGAFNAVVINSELRLRGGSSYRSTAAPNALKGIAAGALSGGARVVGWTTAEIVSIASDDVTPTAVQSTGGDPVAPASRAVVHGGALVMRSTATPKLWVYGGSRKAATGAVTLTTVAGERTVAGTATTFLADTDPGALLYDGAIPSVVDSVDSNTQVTLHDPRHTALAAVPAGFQPVIGFSPYQATPGGTFAHTPLTGGAFSAMTVAANKLLLAAGSQVWVGRPRDWEFTANEYHDIGATVLGLEALGSSSALVFGANGVWEIDNVAYDLTDEAGNPQQQLGRLAPNVVLWNDRGLAAWDGRVVAPALDDVYLFAPGSAPAVISRGIRSLYRSYVRLGMVPGMATVVNGHYVLPILSGGTQADVLVCRLDQTDRLGAVRPAWTRWNSALETQMVVSEPKAGVSRLVAASGSRYVDFSAALTGDPSTDADGSHPQLDVITNDYSTGPGNRNTVTRVRLRYALEGAATLGASYVTGTEAAPATTALPTAGPADGEDGTSWRLLKRCSRIRFRFQSSGSPTTLRVRSLEMFTRDSNRP